MGISGLPTDMTRRRLEVGDGERRWQRGRGGGGSTSASALSAAWLAAARWLSMSYMQVALDDDQSKIVGILGVK